MLFYLAVEFRLFVLISNYFVFDYFQIIILLIIFLIVLLLPHIVVFLSPDAGIS